MAGYVNSEFPLERLSKQLNSTNKRVVALYGLENESATEYLNDIKELNQDNINTAAWTSPAPASKEELAEDIKATLLVNTTSNNLTNIKGKHLLANLYKRFHTNRVRRKINEYQPYRQEKTRTKTLLWPIINTISSLGLALGVPLLSVILFRQQAIIYGTDNAQGQNSGALGEQFYIGMISLAVLLIVLGACSSLLGLIITLIQNKKEYNWSNVNENLQKLIHKYFILKDDPPFNSLPWYQKLTSKNKFAINLDYTFFYTDVDPNREDYTEILELMKILNSLNNNLIFCLINVKYIDEVRIFKNIFPTNKTRILRMDTYKNGTNIRIMTNFMIHEIKSITGLDTQILLRKYPYFTNALYKFIDTSTRNEQFLRALLTLKKFVGKISNGMGLSLNEKVEKYFVDIFCLSIFNGLDLYGFQSLYSDLSLLGNISKTTKENENFINLKIYEILNRNLIIYQNDSIFFKLKEFIIGTTNLKTIARQLSDGIPLEVDWDIEKDSINRVLENRGYQEVRNDQPLDYNLKYVSQFGEPIYIKFAEWRLEHNPKGLVYIESILTTAKDNQVHSFILDIYGMKMFYQQFDSRYELLSIL